MSDSSKEEKVDEDSENQTGSSRKLKIERRKSRFEPHRSDDESEENGEEEKSNEETSKEETFEDSDSDESETEPFVKEKGMVITSFKNRLHEVHPGVPFVPSDRFVTKQRKVSDLDDGGALQRDLDRMENGLYVPRKPEVTKSNLNARGHRDRRDSKSLARHGSCTCWIEREGRGKTLESHQTSQRDTRRVRISTSLQLYRRGVHRT